MSHFAEIDNNNIVLRVIVAEQDVIDTGIVGNKENWIQTSYNTFRGVHLNNETPLRKNYASPGHTYDKTRDAFIRPKPFDSWLFNEDTCDWDALNGQWATQLRPNRVPLEKHIIGMKKINNGY